LRTLSGYRSDLSSGEVALRKGKRLSFRDIGILAALGYDKLPVYIKPKVSILSTGNELNELGKKFRLWKNL
jgi:molybdopterin biosynthesis enzyme